MNTTANPQPLVLPIRRASRNRHLARRCFPPRRGRPLLSAGPHACQAPSPFRHGGSLGETERAHGGRVATTQCCANHVVLPHLDSLTIPGRRSRCPRVDHTDLWTDGNFDPLSGARCAFACPRLFKSPQALVDAPACPPPPGLLTSAYMGTWGLGLSASRLSS